MWSKTQYVHLRFMVDHKKLQPRGHPKINNNHCSYQNVKMHKVLHLAYRGLICLHAMPDPELNEGEGAWCLDSECVAVPSHRQLPTENLDAEVGRKHQKPEKLQCMLHSTLNLALPVKKKHVIIRINLAPLLRQLSPAVAPAFARPQTAPPRPRAPRGSVRRSRRGWIPPLSSSPRPRATPRAPWHPIRSAGSPQRRLRLSSQLRLRLASNLSRPNF